MRAPDVPEAWRVLARRAENDDVVTLRAVPVDGAPPTFAPAQFSMIGVFGVGEVPVSISSSPSDRDAHEFTLRHVGAVTEALFAAVPGDVITVRGPFGRPWDLNTAVGHPVLFVAGGIGLAPLRAAIETLADRRTRVGADPSITVLVGAVEPSGLIYETWLRGLVDRGVVVRLAVDRVPAGQVWSGHVGFVTELIAPAVRRAGGHDGDGAAGPIAYVCGPDPMMAAAIHVFDQAGVAPDDVQVTLERNMYCASGWCGHCQLGPMLVCRDGPVATAAELGDLLERSAL